MDRQTLHDAATNAAGQNQSSHSYSAWRSSQQTQPRILQYEPNPRQQQQNQQPQPQQTQQALAAQQATPTGADPGTMDKNIIFGNTDTLSQQYNLNAGGAQTQTIFALHPSPAGPTQSVANPPPLAASTGSIPPDSSKDSSTTPGQNPASGSGRQLATSKRAAQNRAAQRAFRHRKERYIKSLEEKANNYDLSQSLIADLRKENIYLRDYVVRLQNEVDSLNTELGRAPMFAAHTQQGQQQQQQQQLRPQQQQQQVDQQGQQGGGMLQQGYAPMQIDPQIAAAMQVQEKQQGGGGGVVQLAPAEHNVNVLGMGEQQMMVEQQKAPETGATQKKARGRKRKNDVQQTDGQQ